MTSWLLIFIVLAAPIPMASNRPIFWMLSGATIGFVACMHFFVVGRNRWHLRYRPQANPILWGGVAMYLAVLVAQVVPIGTVWQQVEFRFPGTTIYADTLSLTPRATLLALLRTIGYAFFFLLMLEVSQSRERARRMAWAIFVGIVLHAAWAMLSLHQFQDTFFWGGKDAYVGVATGTFINRNSFATFLGFGLVLGLSLLSTGKRSAGGRPSGIDAESVKVYLQYFLVLVLLVTLLSTESRMGLFATLVAASTTLAVALMKRRKTDRSALILASSGIFVLFGAGAWLYGGALFERLIFVQGDADSRVALYAQIIDMIRARPWLGYGADSLERVFPLFHERPVSIDLSWDKAHSTYLTLWSGLGLIVGSIPLLLCAGILGALARYILGRDMRFELALAAFGVIILASLHSLVDFSLEIQANAYVFLAILALGVSQIQHPTAGASRSDSERTR